MTGSSQDLLRVVTCGSVDDGKSTLIGRLVFELGGVPDDQLAGLADDRGAVDYARLFDGLEAEREQGITIDVAHRFLETPVRRYAFADAPGHRQYTRNLATAASNADLAIVLIDAERGPSSQTRRHLNIVTLMGVKQVVMAVSKMDRIDWSETAFRSIADEIAGFATRIGLKSLAAIPVSGSRGANVTRSSTDTPWYTGPTLLELMQSAPPRTEELGSLRLSVQSAVRTPDFRGFAGRVARGVLQQGQAVKIMPSGHTSRIARILAGGDETDLATAGRSVTVTLQDEIDCSRGDMIVDAGDPPEVADQFEATVIWMADEPMLPGRSYTLKTGTRTVSGQVTALKYVLNVDTLEHLAGPVLPLNGIGACNLSLSDAIAFEPYAQSRALGGFILIDKTSQSTVGAGMLRRALRRSHTVAWQSLDVSKDSRAAMKGQTPTVVWLTGLSGAGKSTIANLVERRLSADGRHTYLLDGDNVRHGLCRDLGFTDADRVENVRRVAEVAGLMADAGLIVLVSMISPFRAERHMARELLGPHYVEVFVDVPLSVAESRDVKGLYARARAGTLKNFTGIDSPYEAPENPEVTIDTTRMSADTAAEKIVRFLNFGGAPEP